jgi:hypothetical protein
MTYLERTIVRYGHPRRIIVGVISMIWMLYFMWAHNWIYAVVALVAGLVLGRVATLGMHEEQLARTTLGKILLLHLHPVNLLLQSAGFGLLLYSFWIHSSVYLLLAVSVILLGHLVGWHKVNEAL